MPVLHIYVETKQLTRAYTKLSRTKEGTDSALGQNEGFSGKTEYEVQ